MGQDTEQAGQLRSIHADSSIVYYKDLLGADRYIINILEEHFTIPLSRRPSQFQEQNNFSTKKYKKLLWDN